MKIVQTKLRLLNITHSGIVTVHSVYYKKQENVSNDNVELDHHQNWYHALNLADGTPSTFMDQKCKLDCAPNTYQHSKKVKVIPIHLCKHKTASYYTRKGAQVHENDPTASKYENVFNVWSSFCRIWAIFSWNDNSHAYSLITLAKQTNFVSYNHCE